MSTTYDIERLTPAQRAQFDAMSSEAQQRFLDAMSRVMQQPPPQRIEVPPPPPADEHEIARDALLGGADPATADVPDSLLDEFEAQVGRRDEDLSLDPAGYRHPVRMLTLDQAADLMGVSRSVAYRLIDTGMPAFRMFRTVRVRSDCAWAMRNRLAAGIGHGGGLRWSAGLRRANGAVDRGVPINEVAAALQVHPQTLWRWGRHFQAVATPGQPMISLVWRVAGRRDNAVIPEHVLATSGIPYKKSSLRLIRFSETRLFTAAERRLIEKGLRQVCDDGQVRRKDHLRDEASRLRFYRMDEAAQVLRLSVSGARKALSRAGIRTPIVAGAARVGHDDLFMLMQRRIEKGQGKTRQQSDDDPLLVPVADAAKRMNITVRTLRRRAAAGKINVVTADERLWVRRHEVEAVTGALAEQQWRDAVAAAQAPEPDRGADLTDAHISNFTDWVARYYPDIDIDTVIFTRAGAADRARCRPSVIEALVCEGLIPAQRQGRDLRIRTVDLLAAAVFSSKVARMCPNLRVDDPATREAFAAEFLTFDAAAAVLERPVSEVRYLVRVGTLHAVRFGHGAHRLHESELTGPGLSRFKEDADPCPERKTRRPLGWGHTVNDAATALDVSERTVLRWIAQGSLSATAATRDKWRRTETGGYRKVPVPVNRGGYLVSERSVIAARRLRQVREQQPRDPVAVTSDQLASGQAPELQPWQRYRLVNEAGRPIDEYGELLTV